MRVAKFRSFFILKIFNLNKSNPSHQGQQSLKCKIMNEFVIIVYQRIHRIRREDLYSIKNPKWNGNQNSSIAGMNIYIRLI